MLENYKLAIDDFTRSIKIDPNYVKAYNNKGWVYDKLGDYEKAIADYTRAIKIDPNNYSYYITLGDAFMIPIDQDHVPRAPAALKKYSSSGFERWTKGTAESGLHGGHTGQIYSEEVTPKTKKFTMEKVPVYHIVDDEKKKKAS